MDVLTKNEVTKKIIAVLKNADKKISYSQAVDILENTKEKLKAFRLFKN